MDILLQFTYKPDGASADLFRDRVQRVTLCVYRTDGSIEHTRTLEKNELDRLQGVEMYLPQGTYTVALWYQCLEYAYQTRRIHCRTDNE
ncbi:FimB/Mfa2 family fimbrial subunit [Bacteroides ovatus]|nr:FimB/Mfa2 family fimbrial subunit [Bacteroides ovatus]